MHTGGKGQKKILTSLEKNFMYTWRTKIIYMRSRSPPSTPTPLTFLMVHPLVINIMYTWRTQKIYVQSRNPPSTPSTPTPLTFLMVHPLVIVEITQQMAWTKQIKRRHSPLQKLYGEWVQAFGETVCGIVWVDKDCLRLVMVLKATINQSWLTLIHPNDPTNRFAKGLYPFLLQFLG